jgi:hypothetical protein
MLCDKAREKESGDKSPHSKGPREKAGPGLRFHEHMPKIDMHGISDESGTS